MSFAALSIGVLFVCWAVISALGANDLFIPSPVAVKDALINLFVERSFARDMGISIARIMAGFIAASVLGVPIGVCIGVSRRAEALLEPSLDFIRYIPIPAFIPLFILWFGIGEVEKVVVIAFSVLFQVVLMVANSVALTPRPIIDAARTLGVTGWRLVGKVIFQLARPKIWDDLRVSMGWAWAVLTIAEMVGATSGIGFVIIQSQRLLQTPQVMGAIIIVGLLGLITDGVFKWTYRALFPWAPRTHQHVEL